MPRVARCRHCNEWIVLVRRDRHSCAEGFVDWAHADGLNDTCDLQTVAEPPETWTPGGGPR